MKQIINTKLSLLFVFFICSNVNATTIAYLDSVKNVYNTTKNQEQKLYAIYTLSFEYGLIDPELGIDYGRKCLKLATKLGNLSYQLNAYNGIANAFESYGNYDSALFYHKLSQEVAFKTKSRSKITNTIVNIALCYLHKGYYQTALSELLKAYEVLIKNETYNPRIHYYLGELYLKINDLKNAEYHSKIGIQKCKEFQVDYISFYLKANLAKCYLIQNKPAKAIELLEKSKKGLWEQTDKVCIALCLTSLGEAYQKVKNYQKALEVYKQELLIQKEIDSQTGELIAYINLAQVSSRLNKKNQAIEFLILAEKLLPAAKSNYDILPEAYYKMALTYEELGKTIQAISYYKKHNFAQDSLLSIEKMRQLSDLQTKYETEKKAGEILSLKQKNKINLLEINAKNQNIKKSKLIILSGSISFVLVLIIMFFFIQRQRLKNKLEQINLISQTQEKERNRIAKDIHDELGSGLSKIRFLTDALQKTEDKSEFSRKINSINYTAFSLVENMREMIWSLDPKNNTLENLIVRMREYVYDYFDETQIHCQIDFPTKIPQIKISNSHARNIFSTVKESLQNAFKHAYTKKVELKMEIDFANLKIYIQDFGTGFQISNVKHGNGLKNMQTRMENIGGKFEITNPNGTLITLVVPLSLLIQSGKNGTFV